MAVSTLVSYSGPRHAPNNQTSTHTTIRQSEPAFDILAKVQGPSCFVSISTSVPLVVSTLHKTRSISIFHDEEIK